MIGVIADSNLLIVGAVVLVISSCVRYPQSTPTNYTEKFGPPDPSDLPTESNFTPFTETKTQEGDESKD